MMEQSPPFSAAISPHVLQMDGVAAILDLPREILEENGYRVTTSPERLSPSLLRAVSPDAVLQACRFAGTPTFDEQYVPTRRGDSALADIPIIFCTTCPRVVQDVALAEQLRQLHVCVVRKPFDVDELLAILAEALTPSLDEFVGDLSVASTP